jgi:hypothetical protein
MNSKIWSRVLKTVGGLAMVFGTVGIGGKSGRSLWWGLALLPYPVGWLMALIAGVIGLLRFCKAKLARPTNAM